MSHYAHQDPRYIRAALAKSVRSYEFLIDDERVALAEVNMEGVHTDNDFRVLWMLFEKGMVRRGPGHKLYYTPKRFP